MDASSYVAQVHIVIHVTKYNSLIYDVHMLDHVCGPVYVKQTTHYVRIFACICTSYCTNLK